ncbi:COG1835 Predicted acyltransferases [Burkholderiaceae bacterium]
MKLPYRKEIDGLRAVAVMSIVLFHAGFKVFEGGYVGVDIFFVISGFLITSIIVQDHRNSQFSFAAFYERRARRLLPALFVVLLLCVPFAWIQMLPGELTEFSKSLLSVLGFGSNFYFWQDSGYFATSAEFRPLLHTWSLAVEEQFYLVFPAVLLVSLKFARSATTAVLLLIGLASFAFSAWASLYKPTFAFFLLPTRVWEFTLGALAAQIALSPAYLRLQTYRFCCQALSLLALLLIIYSIFAFKKADVYPGYLALVPVFGTSLLLVFSTNQTWVGRALGTKPLVMIGLVSYSAYLWHQPLFAFYRLRELDPLSTAVSWTLICCSFSLGYLTWRFIEPIWRVGKTTPKRSFWWFLGFCACAFVLFFLVVKYTGGYLFRLNHLPKDYFQTSWINYKFHGLNNQQCYTDVMTPCPLTSFAGQDKNLLMVGDSHAGDFGGAFTEYLQANGLNGSMFSVLGCGYVSNLKDTVSNTSCSKSRALLLDLANKKIFTTYLLVSAGELHTAAEVNEFKELVKDLLNTKAEVILFEPRARLKYDPKKAGVLQQNSKNTVITFDAALNQDWVAALKELNNYSNFKIFDQHKALLQLGCDQANCFDGHTKTGHLIYRDPTHLTDLGAKAVFKSFNTWYHQGIKP